MPDTIRLTDDDFALLHRLEEADEVEDDLAAALDDLWGRVESALQRATGQLDDEWRVDLWPWNLEGDRFPFVWARCKLDEADEFAAHLGAFLSPGHCNLCLDLEKDALDDGSAAETLDQVRGFWRGPVAPLLRAAEDPRLKVWTDPDNVVAPEIYVEEGLGELLSRNNDPEHPWPRVGYLPSRQSLVGVEDLVALLVDRFRTLAPLYRGQIAYCRG
ncbi:MAG: hypothetical protein ACOC5E_01420 [Acidobacteriota bacterium]